MTEESNWGTATGDDGSFFFVYDNLMGSITLNHIGIATAPGNAQLSRLFTLLGITRGATEAVPEQGVNVHFFNLPGHAPHLELLEVEDPEGAVAKFIQKRGPGIHHLSFSIDPGGLDPLCSKLRSEGFQLIYDTPKRGAQNMRINFIHPGPSGGVLIELMETADAHQN